MIDSEIKKNPPPQSVTTDRAYYLFALRIAGDFGASLALPVVVLVLIGTYLDHRYNTSPRATIVAFIMAAIISAKIIYKKAKRYGVEYQNMNAVK